MIPVGIWRCKSRIAGVMSAIDPTRIHQYREIARPPRGLDVAAYMMVVLAMVFFEELADLLPVGLPPRELEPPWS